jgi:hypothetical protein
MMVGDFEVPAREPTELDFDAAFSALPFSFVFEERDRAPRFRFAPNDARTAASSFRPSVLISGGPSAMLAQ